MLKLIFARSGYGKTEYVFNNIKKLVDAGEKDILLITPEQYSFIAERRLLTDLGEKNIGCVDNSSFSRISNTVKEKYGSGSLSILSKSAKLVLMLKAIDKSKDELQLFNSKLDSLSFVSSMISVYDEMKSCNLSSDEIISLSSNIDNVTLKKKLADISLIMRSYEELINGKYYDSASELSRVYSILEDKNFFGGKNVFIDGFNGFVAQEYKLLELVIKEAKCVTITLCTDDPDSDDSFSLFGYVNNTSKIIEKIATKANVVIERVKLNTNYRSKNDDIKLLERNILTASSKNIKPTDKISIYKARNITDECVYTAIEIRKLLRNGMSAKDIAVICRNLNSYRDELSVVFKKYQVPFYNDERQPIKNQPLVVFIEYLLRCVNYSLRSDDILSLAKTGLTPLSLESINELENYIYIWNINGLKWTKDFENSPKGFSSELSDNDKKLLDSINETRETLIKPILDFKNKVKNASAKDICAQIYYTLIKFGVDEQIKKYALELQKSNQHILAQEQGRVWDLVMEILNDLQVSLDEDINLKSFANIFSLVISNEDLGAIPAGVDNIQLGQADRIRTNNPRVVFILGANEGVFPQIVTSGGLLSESDRRILLDNDFKLYSYGEILNLQERYFAYMACSCASDNVYLSYLSGNSSDIAPSDIILSAKANFNIKENNYNSFDDLDLIETYDNAFDLMSERYSYNTEFYSSLKEFFKNDSRYESIKALVENKGINISNKNIATSLFDYNMYVSASRVEEYYNCQFKYFCKFGLRALPLSKAEIDPMQKGTLIHYVLEMIISEVGSKKLATLTESEIVILVNKYLNKYFAERMGNINDMSFQFKYNYKRLAKLIYSVVMHLAREFSVTDFEAKAFELSIDKDGEVKPEILKLDDGGTLQIRGSIDRVDTYDMDGERYVRVVDYKSGKKEFKLSDILNGLNLQMFIYLFSLCEDKSAELNGKPAGVLYLHSAREVYPFESKRKLNENITSKEKDSFKMKGIVVSDNDGDIARAMEHDLNEEFIPVSVNNKTGELKGQLASIAELGLLHKKINALLASMGMGLHNGIINQNPISDSNHSDICQYCDYSDVCANRKSIETRELNSYKNDEVINMLNEEYGCDA